MQTKQTKPLKIAVDARWIFPEISGIGHYTRELLREFADLPLAEHFLVLFDNPDMMQQVAAETGINRKDNFKTHLAPYGVFSLKSQATLPHLLHKLEVDVYHSPNYMIPLAAFPVHRRRTVHSVVTIHDVIPLLFPDHAPRSRKSRLFWIYRRLMNEVGKRADSIITVSEASRRDVIRELKIPPSRIDRVHAIYNGVSDAFHPPRKPVRKKASECRTILYVGRADPYKNVERLIEAFARVRKSCPFPVRLLVAGARDSRYPEAPRLAEQLHVSGSIEWTGYLSDQQLVQTYQQADVLVHPSRYEGFGLQILEAMACATPVVCSNLGSLPEVAGDAALLVDPGHVEALAQAVRRVLTDEKTAARLRKLGLARAREFTWRHSAERTLHVYRDAALST